MSLVNRTTTMTETTAVAPSCEVCGPPIDLSDGRVISVHHANENDAADLGAFYRGLDTGDLLTRFFSAGQPSPDFLERWVSIDRRGGCCLLVRLRDDRGLRVIAEAGFSKLDDGDGELGIAVDPHHRGWMGSWLLDLLLGHAAALGVQNLQALVKTHNRPMLEVIGHRGCARFDDTDWETTRVTMATAGRTPSWPPQAPRPHVLIESPSSRPDAARRVRQVGGTTLICSGYDRPATTCPLHHGRPCPLIADADAVVIDGTVAGGPDGDAVAASIRATHPRAHLVLLDDLSGEPLPIRRAPIDLGLDCPADDDSTDDESEK